jgi:surface antigen
MFSRDGEKSESVGAPGRLAAAPGSAEADLAFAKAAAAEALARAGDVSVPWENPGTGARGTVTPLASAYTQDGFTCRDFLASYVRKDSESWLQGEGCRIHQGRWEVRRMKPLQRP